MSLKSLRAYRQLRDEVLEGRLQPGERLAPATLSARLGVSVLPIREALWMLSRDGLVEMQDFIGARVRIYGPREIQESLFIRGNLEGLATALAAPHFDAELGDYLDDCLARMESVIDSDADAYAVGNREFHNAIFERCPNECLRELIQTQSASQIAYQSVFRLNPTWLHQSLKEHREILGVLRSGDTTAAQVLATQHKLHLAAALVDALPDSSEDSEVGS